MDDLSWATLARSESMARPEGSEKGTEAMQTGKADTRYLYRGRTRSHRYRRLVAGAVVGWVAQAVGVQQKQLERQEARHGGGASARLSVPFYRPAPRPISGREQTPGIK